MEGLPAFSPDNLESFKYLDNDSLNKYIDWALWWGNGDRIQLELDKVEQFMNLPTELLATFMVAAMNDADSIDSYYYARHPIPPESVPYGDESSCYSYSVSPAEVAKLKRKAAKKYRKHIAREDKERGKYLALALYLEKLKEQERKEPPIYPGLVSGYDFRHGDIVLTFEWRYPFSDVPTYRCITICKISDDRNFFGVPILESVTEEESEYFKSAFQEIWIGNYKTRHRNFVAQCLNERSTDEDQTRLCDIAKYDVLKYYAEHPEYIALHHNLIAPSKERAIYNMKKWYNRKNIQPSTLGDECMTATDHFAITGFIVLCALIAIGVHICNLAVKDMGLSRDLRKITFLYPSRIREGQGPESGMLLQDISNITGRCLSKYKQLLPRVEQCRLKNLERPIHPNRVRIDGICTDLLDRKKWIAILQCYQITAENIALLRISRRFTCFEKHR